MYRIITNELRNLKPEKEQEQRYGMMGGRMEFDFKRGQQIFF
jgi:hypothetical protein